MKWPIFKFEDKDMCAKLDKLESHVHTLETKCVALEVRADGVDKYIGECKTNHTSHQEYRRSTDNRLENTNTLISEILGVLKEYAPDLKVPKENVPTIKRSARNYSALDLFREWGGWIISAILSLGGIYHLFF